MFQRNLQTALFLVSGKNQMSETINISQQKCFTHPNREAVAQCPNCHRTFCRECVTEHDDKVLCALCLKKITEQSHKKEKPKLVNTIFSYFLSLFILWFLFFMLGKMLLLIPDSFHEGTFWKSFISELK